jgi:hypothetical protein
VPVDTRMQTDALGRSGMRNRGLEHS